MKSRPEVLDDGWDEGFGRTVRRRVRPAHRSDPGRNADHGPNNRPGYSFDQSSSISRARMVPSRRFVAHHAYLGMVAGSGFRIPPVRQTNAAALLAKELTRPGYVQECIAMGTTPLPYQTWKRQDAHHAACWKCCATSRHRSPLVTKFAGSCATWRSCREMAVDGDGQAAALSITTLDRNCGFDEQRAGTSRGGT